MGRYVSVILAVSLLAQGLCVPASVVRPRRESSNISDNTIAESSNSVSSSTVNYDLPPPIPYNDDDDQDDDDLDIPTKYPSDGGGGSNVFSLLRLVSGLLPGSSSSSSSSGTEKSSGEPAPSPLWTLKLDILRALLQFGTSILGIASSAVFSSSSG